MARRRQAESKEQRAPSPQVSHEELQRQVAEQAEHLRSLAASVRARLPAPDVSEYVRTGRGPAYQRDREAWLRNIDVAYAFEAAASRLEEALRPPPAGR